MSANIEERYRYEKKYLVPEEYNDLVFHYIFSQDLRFLKHYEKRIINSIYFDNDDLEMYFKNIDGLSTREKYRIRWYGNTNLIKNPVLEVKRKINNYGEKSSYRLNIDSGLDLNDLNNLNFLTNIVNKKISINKENFLTDNLRPKIIVSYLRYYYKSIIYNLRLTLDKDIKYKLINTNSKIYKSPHYSNKNSIIELKYPIQIHKDIISSNIDFPFRLQKNSKYVEGMSLFLNKNYIT